MMYAWAKHIQKYPVVEINWRASGQWERKGNTEATKLLGDIRRFLERKGCGIGNNLSKIKYEQILKQVECDVLAQRKRKILAIEMAFHSHGLGYGSPKENKCRYLKKMINLAVVTTEFFPNYEKRIVFASPLVSTKSEEEINEAYQLLNAFFLTPVNKKNYKIKMELYVGKDSFNRKIRSPLVKLLNNKKRKWNYTDLYMRGCLINDLMSTK